MFIKEKLKLQIHPNKVTLRKLSQGIDYVGYVALPHHSLPRRKTVTRMLKKLITDSARDIEKALPSYLGHIQHANSNKLLKKIENIAPKFDKHMLPMLEIGQSSRLIRLLIRKFKNE